MIVCQYSFARIIQIEPQKRKCVRVFIHNDVRSCIQKNYSKKIFEYQRSDEPEKKTHEKFTPHYPLIEQNKNIKLFQGQSNGSEGFFSDFLHGYSVH